MKISKKLLPLVLCLFVANVSFGAMSVDNYFNQPQGTSSTDNILTIGGSQNVASGGTLTVQSGGALTLDSGSTLTFTATPTFNGGIVVNEDVDINFDARDEEFNITQSSQGLIVATIYNSATDLAEATSLLSLDFKDNGDAEGIFLQCRDNTYANTVFEIGADGVITIDASGAGSGTVLSEDTMVVNDAAFDWDSETQDLNIGDGTNDVNVTDDGVMTFAGDARIDSETNDLEIGDGTNDIVITDNGVATFAGTAYIDSETNDLEIGDGTNNTVFADDGVISQTGDAQASLLDVTIAGTGLNLDGIFDMDIALRASNFNVTTSSNGLALGIFANTMADLEEDSWLLSLDYTDNGDANGFYLRCRDNSAADTVLSIGAQGAITIDADGAGTGTILSEATLVANDATFRIDSETQDLQIGDGINNTVFANDGAINQTGDATLTIQDGSDLICSANANASPFLSASSADTASGVLTCSGGITIPSGGTFTIEAGATVISTAAAFMNITGAEGLTVAYDVGAGSVTTTAEMTVGTDLAVGDDLTLAGATGSITLDVSAGGAGTVLSEGTMVVNDAAFVWDSETQDLQIGDGTNDLLITDNGVVTFAGTAYIDSETNDLEIGDGTNNTVVSDDGAVTQTGTATLTLQDGSDLIITANDNAGPFLSATQADTAAGAITYSVGIINDGKYINTSYETVTDSFTITASTTTNIFYVNFSAGGAEVTLPAATAFTGAELTFISIGAGAVTFSENINGGAYTAVDEAGDAITIHSNGALWYIKSNYETP